MTLDEDYDYGTRTPSQSQVKRSDSSVMSQQNQQQNRGVRKGLGAIPMGEEYNTSNQDESIKQQQQQQQQQGVDLPALSPKNDTKEHDTDELRNHNNIDHNTPEEAAEEDDDALLDLDQLEQLHNEAERMKALGNKHMAAQEYTRAYNAYSAALQLSPVGPSSHVFLSNRSAALLSLKRYSAAAIDARRAIALAPTFGKAHARLGQSLYFLKNYEGAVSAYEDAIHYEPDNLITKTYLKKARSKRDRQNEKAMQNRLGGEEVSVLTSESSIQPTVANSVATDPNASAAVVTRGFRGQSSAIMRAVGGGMTSNKSPLDTSGGGDKDTSNGTTPTLNENSPFESQAEYDDEDATDNDDINLDDPDFDEALRIQERANRYLANKNYKFAIEEYTAALFLIPDDANLSPELHLGRAHALNGSRRHESAKIDSQLALKIKPTPEAYSTLAKSLFYMKDYEGSIKAFGQCKQLLPHSESLSMFDRAYLQKAEAATQNERKDGKNQSTPSSSQSMSFNTATSRLGSSAPIPKLKPPKFVSREEALTRTPNMPAMPKQWPQQSPSESEVVKYYGEEREVVFLSEALGIKLNRGPDGVVRVIDVSPDIAGSPIAREGNIEVGDVIREAAGVDIRRPITNIMWGDTVALIKMAPRPIVLVVAKESTESIMDGRKRAAHNALSPTSAAQYFPSNASTEESVKEQMKRDEDSKQKDHLSDVRVEPQPGLEEKTESMKDIDVTEKNTTENTNGSVTSTTNNDHETNESIQDDISKSHESDPMPEEQNVNGMDAHGTNCTSEDGRFPIDKPNVEAEVEQLQKIGTNEANLDIQNAGNILPNIDLRDQEADFLGAEIIFESKKDRCYNGWDNLRWMAYSGIRKIIAVEPVYKYFEGRKGFLWNSDEYELRKLAVYEHPNVILILREASCLAELRDLMELPTDAQVDESSLSSHLFVESVIDPKTAKLRLSPLTTATSIIPGMTTYCERRLSCFELIYPAESISISAVRLNKDAACFTDSGAFLETSGIEFTLMKCICSAYEDSHNTSPTQHDGLGWKHQIILGTLFSFVVLGNHTHLDLAINQALKSKNGQSNLDMAIQEASEKPNPRFLNPSIIDAIDESGKTALHYACERRCHTAVLSLVKAGADLSLRVDPGSMSPCHICAKKLDFKSLEAILAVSREPNEVDSLGRSPLYTAITEGRSVGGHSNPLTLERCIATLAKFGGKVGALLENRHPASILASQFQADELNIFLKFSQYKYPLRAMNEELGISLSALYQYPIHSTLIAMRRQLCDLTLGCDVDQQQLLRDCASIGTAVNKTLKVLISFGFEPNERIEGLSTSFRGMNKLIGHIGFAPTQIVLAAILDTVNKKKDFDEILYVKINDTLVSVMECMFLRGARVFPDSPPLVRTVERRQESKLYCTITTRGEDHKEGGARTNNDYLNRSQVNTHGSIELTNLLGKSALTEAQLFWKNQKPSIATSNVVLHNDKSKIENSLAPGGSDDSNCSICWKKFGMMTRKHRCRISRRFICDECSTHRIFVNNEEHRVSDGQFWLFKVEELKQMGKIMKDVTMHDQEKKPPMQTKNGEQNGEKSTRLDKLGSDEHKKRDLFSGIVATVNKSFGATEASDPSTNESDTLDALSSQLHQTRDALNERGDKLSTLNDKSDKLVNASQNFAALARDLNRKSNKSFFSW